MIPDESHHQDGGGGVAAEIIPGRPPVTGETQAMAKEAKRPTFGSTPAMTEKPIALGIK